MNWLIGILSALVSVWSAMNYWGSGTEVFFDEQQLVYLRHRTELLLHVVFGPLALVLGPVQFSSRLRTRKPRLHRWMGAGYFCSVTLAGIGGLMLAPHAYGRPETALGFALLGVAWLTTAGMALWRIRRGDVEAHRRWVLRNFSLTFAAVTLRIWVPTLMAVGEIGFESAYAIAAWASWIPNLLVAEVWARKRAHHAALA